VSVKTGVTTIGMLFLVNDLWVIY